MSLVAVSAHKRVLKKKHIKKILPQNDGKSQNVLATNALMKKFDLLKSCIRGNKNSYGELKIYK